MFSRIYSVCPTSITGQKDFYTISAEYVQDLQSIRSARSRINLRSCPLRITSLRRITREVQSMDLPKSNMITSKRKIQLETHRRKNIRLLRTEITVGWTEEYLQHIEDCQYIRIRSCQFFWSIHYYKEKECGSYENNLTFDVNTQGSKSGPMKIRTDFPRAVL